MPATELVEVIVRPLDLPLTEPFAIASGTQHAAENVLVEVHLADGTRGIGEGAPFPAVSGETQTRTLAAIDAVRERLRGRDARGWRPIAEWLAAELPDEPSARCALETALLDALARHHRLSLWSWFGGAVPALETDMTITAGDREHAAAAARAIVDRGIHVIKVKVGALEPDADVERLVAIHREVPQARLIADANGGYRPAQALAFLDRCERAGIPLDLIEQPVAREDWSGQAEVTRRSPVLVCADESSRSSADVLRIIREGAAHAINIKLMKSGVLEALSMWQLARAAGLKLMIGQMVESVLATSFALCFSAGLGGFDYVDLDMPMFFAAHPFRGGFRQTGARLSIDHVVAGHGVELG